MVAAESVSAVCPARICRGPTPAEGGDRAAARRRAPHAHAPLGRVDAPRAPPTLYVHHALLPHEPWIYLPSGRQTRPPGKDPVGAINRPIGFHDQELTDHNHLRHLLQVGSVDRDIGFLIRRLRRPGSSTARWSSSWPTTATPSRSAPRIAARSARRNIEQIAPVPFFVKAPGQRRGRVDDRLVRTVDVLPTIAGPVGARIPWRHEGRSAFARSRAKRDEIRIPRRDFSRVISISRSELGGRRRDIWRWRARKFGTGAESRLFLGDPWASAYRIGPHPELIGTVVRAGSAPAASARAMPANAELLRAVPAHGGIFPTRVTGHLREASPAAHARPGAGGERPHRGGGAELPAAGPAPGVVLAHAPRDGAPPRPQQRGAARGRPGGRLTSLGRSERAAGTARWCRSGRPRRCACVLAAGSLALPSALGYDPYAWLVWGRELAHLDLSTTGGPSFKPLPALVTAPLSPAPDLVPPAWALIVRSTGLLGVVLAFRVAARLAGPAAGATAALATALAEGQVRNGLQGYSEPLLICLALGAVDAHLAAAGVWRSASACSARSSGRSSGCSWRSRRSGPGARTAAFRPALAGGLVAVPALWVGLDWWGSGELLHGGSVARSTPPESAALTDRPALTVVRRAAELVTAPVLAAALAAAAMAVQRRDRRGRRAGGRRRPVGGRGGADGRGRLHREHPLPRGARRAARGARRVGVGWLIDAVAVRAPRLPRAPPRPCSLLAFAFVPARPGCAG